MSGIIIAVVLILLVLWVASTRRSLAVMEDNVNNAMSQLGVQLASRFDALSTLLELTKGYAAQESQSMLEAVRTHRSAITANSAPKKVQEQEGIISEALRRIARMAETYPALKTDAGYLKYINAIDSYGVLVRTSRLLYNDAVTRLNRTLRMFPTSLIAGILGFHQREYLEAVKSADFDQ